MSKVLIQFGLLIFCFAFIFFSQREMPLYDALLKAFTVFIVLMIVVSVLALLVLKAVNRAPKVNSNEHEELLAGKK
jgi:uncharacterized membrane protein